MAIQSQPSRIPEPFAGSGTKNVIPATNATPSASQAASWASGFPPECSQPISAGGCPVPRNDVNGALNQLSQDLAFRQDGGIWEWSALADYDIQRVVRGSDGLLYWSVQQSGPGIAAGAQDPTADTTHAYWISPQIPEMPVDDVSSASVSSSWVKNWYMQKLLTEDLYVDAVNGDDSNNGVSQGQAFKTIYALENYISSPYVLRPSAMKIHVAPGIYSPPAGRTNVASGVSGCLLAYEFQSGVTLTGSFIVGGSKTVYVGGKVTFDGVSGNRIFDVESGSVLGLGVAGASNSLSVTIKNVSMQAFMFASNNSSIITLTNSSGISFSFGPSCSFSIANVFITNGGFCSLGGRVPTWSGSVTGKRYSVTNLSMLSGVGGANVIPGTIAGSADSTSIFN